MSIKIFLSLLFSVVVVCNAIRISCDAEMIFHSLYLRCKPYWIFKIFFTCIECMSPYYSLLIYYVASVRFHVEFDWFVFGILACASMLFNGLIRTVYIKLNG